MPKKKYTLEAVNARLKAAKIGLSVYVKGDRLYLRGTLPPKPGSTKVKPYQQKIALKLYNNPVGLEVAETKAFEYSAKLAREKFSWIEVQGQRENADSCEAWVERFKQHAMQNVISATGKEAELKWRSQFWHPAYSKLAPRADLTERAIVEAVQQTPPNTRSRQVCCQKMKRLARFAGIELNLDDYRGSYSPAKVERDIPADEDIEAAIDQMLAHAQNARRADHRVKLLKWAWVAGIMATYGVRDHECWYISLHEKQQGVKTVWLANVQDGKTGGRNEIPPLNPQWVERWNLPVGEPPDIVVRENREYGERTAKVFNKQAIAFPSYSLRHAWAIRATIKYGFPTAVVAKWLGHDPSVFLSTYQKHITGSQATDLFFGKI